MFLYLLNNSPIWTDLDKKSRYLRLFITATVIYIVINSFLNSKYVDNIEFLINNKKYLYYLIFFDIAATLLKIYFGKNSDKIEKKIVDREERDRETKSKENLFIKREDMNIPVYNKQMLQSKDTINDIPV